MSAPVKATIVDDIDNHADTPGAMDFCATLDGEEAGIGFVCPCGCGRQGFLPTQSSTSGPRWDWNGDRSAPTLTPSVLQVGGCQWHGYLTDGEWRSC